MKGNLKKSNGITLVALVITIIVLLILAGISIVTIFGENGIMNRASATKEEQRWASVNEQKDLWKTDETIDKTLKTDQKESLDSLLNTLNDAQLLSQEEIDFIKENGFIKIADKDIVFFQLTQTLSEVAKIGDYVQYTAGNGTGTNNGVYTMYISQTGHTQDQEFNTNSYIGPWQILHMDEDKIEIICRGVVGNLRLIGKDGYNNLVSTLNTMSRYYINPQYAIAARSVGSNPENPEGTSQYFTSSYPYVGQYANDLMAADTDYTIDYTPLSTIEELKLQESYWVASRKITSYTLSSLFMIYSRATLVENMGSTSLYLVNSDGTQQDADTIVARGVRPVITLKNDVKVDLSDDTKNGSSSENPWIIK